MKPDCITLKDGTKAHWIGSSNAQKVMINFHGGGYVLPASEFMVDFMFRLQKLLSEDGKDFAILFLSYGMFNHTIAYRRQDESAHQLMAQSQM